MNRGFGKDKIFDSIGGDYGSPTDKNIVKLLDIKSTEVKQLRRIQSDLVLGIEGSEDTVTICLYFSEEKYKGVELHFSDGVIWGNLWISW